MTGYDDFDDADYTEKQKALDKRRLGSRVLLAREERGMTREALAKASGLTVQNIRLIENGDRFPSIMSLSMLCNGLNETPTYFMADLLEGQSNDIYTRLWNVVKRATPKQARIIIDMIESVAQYLPKRENEANQ